MIEGPKTKKKRSNSFGLFYLDTFDMLSILEERINSYNFQFNSHFCSCIFCRTIFEFQSKLKNKENKSIFGKKKNLQYLNHFDNYLSELQMILKYKINKLNFIKNRISNHQFKELQIIILT